MIAQPSYSPIMPLCGCNCANWCGRTPHDTECVLHVLDGAALCILTSTTIGQRRIHIFFSFMAAIGVAVTLGAFLQVGFFSVGMGVVGCKTSTQSVQGTPAVLTRASSQSGPLGTQEWALLNTVVFNVRARPPMSRWSRRCNDVSRHPNTKLLSRLCAASSLSPCTLWPLCATTATKPMHKAPSTLPCSSMWLLALLECVAMCLDVAHVHVGVCRCLLLPCLTHANETRFLD